MTTNQIWLFFGVPFILILSYYISPFITGLWISYSSRIKGRKIGQVHYDKISIYFQDEIKTSIKDNQPSKQVIDDLNKMVKDNISIEYHRLGERYNPQISELQKRIDRIEKLKSEQAKNMSIPTLPKKISEKGKSILEGDLLDSSFWRITCLVYGVFFLLVIDTIVSSEWISQIGMFSKSRLLFSDELINNIPFLKHINLSYNTILGFIMNAALLIIIHLIFHNLEIPVFFKKPYVKIISGIFIILITVLLRFLLPNSGDLVKDVMFTFLWLLLFIASFILLGLAMKHVENNLYILSNLFFFLIIPVSLFTYMCGGLIGVLGKIFEEIFSAAYEIRKARISQEKKNIEDKKQNLEDGFHEGITNEIRD